MKKTICLNMIVKDECSVIGRCLESIQNLIDYWVIVDTGSTDGTQQLIRELLKNIPGELHERAWVNFEHNRNEALKLAKNKCDYLLFIDADEYFVYSDSFEMPELGQDCYIVPVQLISGSVLYRKLLVKSQLDWSWIGVIHEEILSGQAQFYAILNGVTNRALQDGRRSIDPAKYLRDAAILEEALRSDPNNSRYVFYLALSYGNGINHSKSLENHEKRVAMGGNCEEEIFFSMMMIGVMQEMLKMEPTKIIQSYCKAYRYRPTRSEPLCALAQYFMRAKNYLMGYLLAQIACSISSPRDLLFVKPSVYEYEALLQFVNCALLIGRNEEACQGMRELLQKKGLPDLERRQILFYLPQIERSICRNSTPSGGTRQAI